MSQSRDPLAFYASPPPATSATPDNLTALPALEFSGLAGDLLTDVSTKKYKRRSLSIFQRRSSDHNTKPTRSLTMTQSGPKSKKWRLPRKDEVFPTEQGRSGVKGTIVHAVPSSGAPPRPPRTPHQSSERLLLPTSNTVPTSKPLPPIPSPQPGLWTFYQADSNHSSTVSLARGDPSRMFAARKDRRKENEEIIGVYKHGHMKWKSESHVTLVQRPEDAFDKRPDGTPSWSRPSSSSTTSSSKKQARPKIHVVIPSDQRQQQFPCLYHSKIPVQSAKAEFLHSSGSGRTMPAPFEREAKAPMPPMPPMLQGRPTKASTQASRYLEKMEQVMKPSHQRTHSRPSDSSDSSPRADSASVSSMYSSRSSMTSLEDEENTAPWTPPDNMPISIHSWPDSTKRFSVQSPVAAGVFDHANTGSGYDAVQAKPRGTSLDRQVAATVAVPSLRVVAQLQPAPSMKSLRAASGITRRSSGIIRRSSTTCSSTSTRSTSTRSKTQSAVRLDLVGAIFAHESLRAPTPTLSEAAHDLRDHLSSITEASPFQWDEWIASYERPLSADDDIDIPVKLSTTFEVSESPASPGDPPALPKRSSKRLASPRHAEAASSAARRASACSPKTSPASSPELPADPRSSRTTRKSQGLTLSIPRNKSPMPQETKPLPPAPVQLSDDEDEAEEARLQRERDISAEQAEAVILSIFESLYSIDDVYATSALNTGFRRMFKRHEMHILRAVLKNSSAPAWEHREMCPPPQIDPDSSVPLPEHTPKSLVTGHRNDYRTLESIKALILERCQSFLRPATVKALQSKDASESSDVDDALWRLWTFCKIFGCGKGREEDVVAQMDWLRGGVVFHQKACDATMTSQTFNVGGTLANVPDSFAQGNAGGVTAEQLFDMTELWNCLNVLLQGILGRTEEAREHGIYEGTGITEDDVDGEEKMLEEWQYYVLTLGLDTILELGTAGRDSIFSTASKHNWTTWSPPSNGGSRGTFIKEALARTYEEKMTPVVPPTQIEAKEQRKEAHKQRIAGLQTEIRQRKQSGDARQVTMSMERPMSEWESMVDHLIAQSPSAVDSPTLGHNLPPVPALPARFDKPSKRAPAAPPPGFREASHPLKQVQTTTEEIYPAIPATSPQVPDDGLFRQHHPAPPPSLPSTHPISPHLTHTPRTQSHIHPALRTSNFSRPLRDNFPPLAIPADPSISAALRQDHQDHRKTNVNPGGPQVLAHPAQHPARVPTTHKRVGSQHPLQQNIASSDPAANTADKAIYRIVEMGFTAEQARHALRVTDMGDGLRVDRAVELLLRESK